MRAGDLLGSPVLDVDGRKRGVLIEIRTRPERGEGAAVTLVVDGFVLSTRRWRLFGYERRAERGPAVLRAVIRRLHRNTRYARFDQVRSTDTNAVRLRTPWHELSLVHEIEH